MKYVEEPRPHAVWNEKEKCYEVVSGALCEDDVSILIDALDDYVRYQVSLGMDPEFYRLKEAAKMSEELQEIWKVFMQNELYEFELLVIPHRC